MFACVSVCARMPQRGSRRITRRRPSGQAKSGRFLLRKVSLLEACHRADAQGAAELCTNSLLIFQVVGPPLVTAGASKSRRWAGWRMFSKVSVLSYLLYKVTIWRTFEKSWRLPCAGGGALCGTRVRVLAPPLLFPLRTHNALPPPFPVIGLRAPHSGTVARSCMQFFISGVGG